MNTVVRDIGAPSSPATIVVGIERAEKVKLLTRIVNEFPHPQRKGHVDWEGAFRKHPQWKDALGVRGKNFQPLYRFCFEIFGGNNHTKRQLLHETIVGIFYVRLYAIENDDSFWLDWKLPMGTNKVHVGSKSYVNEDECLASLEYCEKELAAIDPNAVKVGTVSALRHN